MTVPEVRRLLLALTDPPERRASRVAWSLFRRRHQARAKQCHRARRAQLDRPWATGGRTITLSTPALVVTQERWDQIAALLPSPKAIGRPPVESRLLLTGILWIMRTGAAWRDFPAEYGHWHTAYTRYQDWQRSGLWPQILDILAQPDHTDAS